jgi:endonuclease YncB( thermonuclease family)
MLRKRTAFVLVLACLAGPAAAGDFSGPARVIDGDTLDVGDVRVRLYGIDAPEMDQTCRTAQAVDWPCGAWVARHLRADLDGRTVACTARGTDRYDRIVAVCTLGGRDVGAGLVAEGQAFAFQRYASDYVELETAARRDGLGLWSGHVQDPAAFRQAARPAAAPPPARDCAIKGNISDKGRILHEPGTKWYDRTRIDPDAGERWFCSVAEAEAAGWRRPGT